MHSDEKHCHGLTLSWNIKVTEKKSKANAQGATDVSRMLWMTYLQAQEKVKKGQEWSSKFSSLLKFFWSVETKLTYNIEGQWSSTLNS